MGTEIQNYPLEQLLSYFDWTPFFISWSLAGKFPKILDDEIVGESARELFNNAQTMLKDIMEHNRFDARAVFTLMPAKRTDSDTVTVYDNDGKQTHEFYHLCQQSDKVTGKPNLSLADFISPKGNDYLGGFTVSIFGVEEMANEYKKTRR